MSAYKIVQKISDLSTGISTSDSIAVKSGYFRIVPETDAYVEIGTSPGVSTTNSIWVKAGTELILKETPISQKIVGITTGTTTIVYIPEGTFSDFSIGDTVQLTGISPSGINTSSASISAIDTTGGVGGGFSRKISLSWDTSSQSAPTNTNGELRRVIKIGASSTGKVHITEIQIAGG
jgi:hypothetical protein